MCKSFSQRTQCEFTFDVFLTTSNISQARMLIYISKFYLMFFLSLKLAEMTYLFFQHIELYCLYWKIYFYLIVLSKEFS